MNFKNKLRKELKWGDDRKRLDFVICFDNAEELISRSQYEFQRLMKILTESCPHLKIVITSNRPLDYKLNIVSFVSRFISGLRTNQAAELFLEILEKNRYELRPDDIRELILLE